jgi:hypothetical protein
LARNLLSTAAEELSIRTGDSGAADSAASGFERHKYRGYGRDLIPVSLVGGHRTYLYFTRLTVVLMLLHGQCGTQISVHSRSSCTRMPADDMR